MLLIGTSGFSYPDWRGAFYPKKLSQRDFLAFYAEHFKALELNSSYYALPAPALIRNLAEYTPDGFNVAVKAFQGITHQRGDDSADILRKFMLLLEPLRECGKLAAVLLQFPYSFHHGEAELDFLDDLLKRLEGQRAVVEFRNIQWWQKSAWEWLRQRGAALCCVDEPPLPGLLPPEVVRTCRTIGYVRFHGRNAEKWFRHEQPWERYHYSYSREELEPWRDKLVWLEQNTDKTLVFFTNHRDGNAVKDARLLAQMLGLFDPGEVDRLGENELPLL